jgi:hypothetical protein
MAFYYSFPTSAAKVVKETLITRTNGCEHVVVKKLSDLADALVSLHRFVQANALRPKFNATVLSGSGHNRTDSSY